MANVKVETETLISGGTYVADKYQENLDKYSSVKSIDTQTCDSLKSFKVALENKNNIYEDHANILSSKIKECANNLEEIDNMIGNNVTSPLASADNLDFSTELGEKDAEKLTKEDLALLADNIYLSNLSNYDLSSYATSAEFSAALHKYLKLMTWSPDNPYNLKGIGATSLYDVANITPEQMKAALENIKANPGRDAIAKAAILMIGTAADAGYKLNYRHAGTAADPHVPTVTVTNGGVDCNAYASWLVDKGVPGGLYWRSVEAFGSIGDPLTDYSKAQCGDIFMTYTSASQKHVGVIVENHPEEGYFITSESSNGIEFKVRTYAELKNAPGIQVRDLTNVYNGTYNANADRCQYFKDADKYKDTW